jgi:hypothetical protein
MVNAHCLPEPIRGHTADAARVTSVGCIVLSCRTGARVSWWPTRSAARSSHKRVSGWFVSPYIPERVVVEAPMPEWVAEAPHVRVGGCAHVPERGACRPLLHTRALQTTVALLTEALSDTWMWSPTPTPRVPPPPHPFLRAGEGKRAKKGGKKPGPPKAAPKKA